MSEPIASRELASSDSSESAETAGNAPTSPKILCLGGTHDDQAGFQQRFGEDVEIVEVSSPARALAHLARGEYIGVYADVDHLVEAVDSGRIVQNERILQGMPDGVVLLADDNVIIWGNGRLTEWTGRDDVVGSNLYQLLGNPEILGPDFCPFHTALSTGKASASTLRCSDNKYFRVHAAPVIEGDLEPQHLVVTLRDVTDEMLQQQKIAAIHQAGIELTDLTTDEVANMDLDERIELLKSNMLHCTQDVLQFDVIEVRMLDQETGVLNSLLSLGMKPEAESRTLRAEATGNGVTGFVAATGQSYLCEDTSSDPLYLEGAHNARSSLTVPVLQHDQVLGTLNVESPEPGAFDESDLQFLEIFARDLAAAPQHARNPCRRTSQHCRGQHRSDPQCRGIASRYDSKRRGQHHGTLHWPRTRCRRAVATYPAWRPRYQTSDSENWSIDGPRRGSTGCRPRGATAPT